MQNMIHLWSYCDFVGRIDLALPKTWHFGGVGTPRAGLHLWPLAPYHHQLKWGAAMEPVRWFFFQAIPRMFQMAAAVVEEVQHRYLNFTNKKNKTKWIYDDQRCVRRPSRVFCLWRSINCNKDLKCSRVARNTITIQRSDKAIDLQKARLSTLPRLARQFLWHLLSCTGLIFFTYWPVSPSKKKKHQKKTQRIVISEGKPPGPYVLAKRWRNPQLIHITSSENHQPTSPSLSPLWASLGLVSMSTLVALRCWVSLKSRVPEDVADGAVQSLAVSARPARHWTI